MESFTVQNNTELEQFELQSGEYTAVLLYEMMEGYIILKSTEVPRELEGKGIGGALAKAGLEHARASGLKVVAWCPFVQSYLDRHPEYQDLLD